VPLLQQPISAEVIAADALRARSDSSFLDALEQAQRWPIALG